MANLDLLENSIPVAPIKIAALKGCEELAKSVDRYLVQFRKEMTSHQSAGISWSGYSEDSFLIDCECPRFGTGEAKGKINESVRGMDLFIMCDVTNYSITYKVSGYENHMSPDDHFQDLKRIIAAATGKAHRINVIMPFLYEGRQHKRTKERVSGLRAGFAGTDKHGRIQHHHFRCSRSPCTECDPLGRI